MTGSLLPSDRLTTGKAPAKHRDRRDSAAFRERGVRWLLGLLGFSLVVALWYAVYWSGVVNRGLLPAPGAVLETLWGRYWQADLMGDIVVSVARVSVGVLVGVGAAVPIGFVLAWYRPIRAIVDPPLNFFRALPPIALIPLVIVYFGIGEFARVSVLVYASFFAGVVVVYEGVSAIDEVYVRAARALGANELEIFARVAIPFVIPHVFVALRVALGVSWATLVAAELIAAQSGLGALIQNAANFFQIPTIYGGIILIGICALLMDQILRAIMARAVRWQERVIR